MAQLKTKWLSWRLRGSAGDKAAQPKTEWLSWRLSGLAEDGTAQLITKRLRLRLSGSAEDYAEGGGEEPQAGPEDAEGAAGDADSWGGRDVVGRHEVKTEITAWK